MNDEEIGRILSREAGIVPSSGFAGAVMEAVRREAAAPPPIPFPWKYAIPGLVAWAVVVVVAVVVAVRGFGHGTSPAEPASFSLARIMEGLPDAPAVLWAGATALALLLALACAKWSLRLAGGRS